MEVQICNDCIRDSGFEEFGTVVAGDQPIACDVCGNEFWSLITARLTQDAPDGANNGRPGWYSGISDKAWEYVRRA